MRFNGQEHVRLIALRSREEWTTEAVLLPLLAYAVCYDTKVDRHNEDMRAHDLANPATTNPKLLATHYQYAVDCKRLNLFPLSIHSSHSRSAEKRAPGIRSRDLR